MNEPVQGVNEQKTQPELTPKQQLENIENVRDLFARAHDYIAQASHPGHLGGKVAEVLNFLKFHYDDFRLRGERMAKELQNTVDVEAAKKAVDAVLVEEKPKS